MQCALGVGARAHNSHLKSARSTFYLIHDLVRKEMMTKENVNLTSTPCRIGYPCGGLAGIATATLRCAETKKNGTCSAELRYILIAFATEYTNGSALSGCRLGLLLPELLMVMPG